VRENKTTIENLEHKNEEYESRYDISQHYNYEQVMGTNRWLDWFPIMPSSAKPKGNGMYFEKNNETEDSEEEGEEGHTGDNRSPAGFGANAAGTVPRRISQGPTQQLAGQEQVARPGGAVQQANNGQGQAVETVTRQGDIMTIHKDRGSQYRNLNDLVRSDNPIQEYKSNESQDKQFSFAKGTQMPKKQFINEVNTQEYQDLK